MCDIEPSTGYVCLEEHDFSLNGENPFFFTRRYNNCTHYEGPFGLGWMHPYDVHLNFRSGQLSFVDAEARSVPLPGLAERGRTDLPAEDLSAEYTRGAYVIHQTDGRMLTFSPEPLSDGRLPLIQVDQTDQNSVYLSYVYGHMSDLRTTSNHRLHFDYHDGRIDRIRILTNRGEVPLASYNYDSNRQLTSVHDAENRAATYSYSDSLLTRVTNRQGGSFYLQYDRRRRATAVWQDGLSRMRRILYDDKLRSHIVTDSLGRSVVLRYNENDLLVEATQSEGSRTEWAYADGNEPIGVIGSGPQLTSNYDPEHNAIEEIDPDGLVVKLKYDAYNRIIEETDPDGGITRYEYDDCNRITRQEDPTGAVTTAEFDQNGNLLRQVQPLGNVVQATRYEHGRVELEDNLGPVYVSEHDAFGNTTKITAPSGNASEFEYDAFGKMITLETSGHTARKWYDANGYLIAESDLMGNRTEYQRDPFGLLLAFINASGRRIKYSYDSERRLVGAKADHGVECEYERDICGRLTRMKLRDGREETFEYNDAGLRTVLSESGGQVTRYTYTPGGRLSGIDFPAGSARYEYDQAGNCAKAKCDGHATSLKWAPGSLLVAEQQDDFKIEYEYNVAGLIAERRDPTGRITRYRYDVRGQLSEITDSVFGNYRIDRDHIGSQTAHRLPNGLVRQFEYDSDDEIARTVTSKAENVRVCERKYQYAANGELIAAETVGGESLAFYYDAVYQLTAISNHGRESETFAYDLDENIVRSAERGEYRYKGSHLVGAGDVSYEYDSSGRVSTRERGGKATQFDYALGGLIREAVLADGTKYHYEYDAFGRRILKSGPGIQVRYHWDLEVLLCEERETSRGKSIIHYLYLPGTFVPLGHAVDGVPFYYELDQRSLIREVYDGAGSVVARFEYRAFGERITIDLATSDADSPFRLQGQTHDEETGLHYNRFRYFDAATGRFITPDLSIRQVEHNSYSYSPNPVKWADPLGLMARFSAADADTLKEQQAAENDGFFECTNCGFKNKNKVFAIAKASGRPVGDGSFHAGHIEPHANGGSADIDTNAKVEGGTCNCSKGKRDKSGMT
jgi:RHS repeat-associated protein